MRWYRSTPQGKTGVPSCYDVEFPEAARYLADHGAEISFVPFCTADGPLGDQPVKT